jgi:hypothetical protein
MKNGIILLFLIRVLVISSCKTDFDVNAPYQDVTVVYGIISINDSTHYIKINKSFLGQADAFDMALVRDSSEYKNINASVEQWLNGQLKKSYTLAPFLVTNKDTANGDFYGPNQIVYVFNEPALNASAEYILNVSLNEGAKKVSAKTKLIPQFSATSDNLLMSSQFKFGLATQTANGPSYNTYEYKFQTVENGKRYQLNAIIHYNEVLYSGTTVSRSINWSFPTIKLNVPRAGEEQKVPIAGEDFYKQMAGRIPAKLSTPNVKWRKFVGIDFVITVAGEDLNTYIEVNEPSIGIIQEKPEFTNIDNGIGIFSTRGKSALSSVRPPGKELVELNTSSLVELYAGQYTKDLGFCADDGQYVCQ